VANGNRVPPAQPASDEFIRQVMDKLPALAEGVRERLDLAREEEARKKRELEVGVVGRWIGDHEHAPTRIAFVVVLIFAVMLVPIPWMIAFSGANESPLLDKLVTGAFSITGAALGFVFGRASSGRSHRPAGR
jgi:hypothetical protein